VDRQIPTKASTSKCDHEVIHTSLVYLTSVARIEFWDCEADKKTCMFIVCISILTMTKSEL